MFDRLAVRLSVDDGTQWILKGGAALEFRLKGRARATKDLDLAVTSGAADGLVIRELLIDALTEDPDGNWFSFRVKEHRNVRASSRTYMKPLLERLSDS